MSYLIASYKDRAYKVLPFLRKINMPYQKYRRNLKKFYYLTNLNVDHILVAICQRKGIKRSVDIGAALYSNIASFMYICMYLI